jgi:hypothetical protein
LQAEVDVGENLLVGDVVFGRLGRTSGRIGPREPCLKTLVSHGHEIARAGRLGELDGNV